MKASKAPLYVTSQPWLESNNLSAHESITGGWLTHAFQKGIHLEMKTPRDGEPLASFGSLSSNVKYCI